MTGFPDFKWWEILLTPFYLLWSFIKELFVSIFGRDKGRNKDGKS